MLNTAVTLNENGTIRKLTTQQAAVLRLAEKAMKGDPRALGMFMDLAERHCEEREARTQTKTVSSADQAILDRYLARHDATLMASVQSGEPATEASPSDDVGEEIAK